MKNYNYILGSGLVALLCRKILGDTWRIVPLGPSKFYSSNVPALGDDFLVYDDIVADLAKEWNLNVVPMMYKRPFSVGGQLMYAQTFIADYLNRMGLPDNPIVRNSLKPDVMVFQFSCLQLWRKLVNEFIGEIKQFFADNEAKGISRIKDGKMWFSTSNGVEKPIEYNKIISTVPNFVLCDLLKVKDPNKYGDLYFYFIESAKIDIDKADQVLICDSVIPFHRCTKIKNRFLIEVLDEYHENPMQVFSAVFGNNFDILKAAYVEKGYPYPGDVNQKFLDTLNIDVVGSLAQCDPLMDMSSCIKRIIRMSKNVQK